MAICCTKYFQTSTRFWVTSLIIRSQISQGIYKLQGDFLLHKQHKSNPRLDSLIVQQHRRCNTSTSVDSIAQKKQIIPFCPPPTADDVSSLYWFLQKSQQLVVLTGAGVSTESGIPDYRSPNGAYSTGFKPITHQEFVRSECKRRRYWARSYIGWKKFGSAQPGPTHKAIAQLESWGYIKNMITQNVDRLHHSAGSIPLELHGTTHEVVCLNCSEITSRQDFQDHLAVLNEEWASTVETFEKGKGESTSGILTRPDGDVEIDDSFWEGKLKIPECQQCGGILKPNVVLFGDNLPKSIAEQAQSLVSNADAVLVIGSSLMVLSAYRLAKRANEKGLPLAIINIGSTRADDLASLKIQCRSGEILSRLLDSAPWFASC